MFDGKPYERVAHVSLCCKRGMVHDRDDRSGNFSQVLGVRSTP